MDANAPGCLCNIPSQGRAAREKRPPGFSPNPPNFGIFRGYWKIMKHWIPLKMPLQGIRREREDPSSISWDEPALFGMSGILGWQFHVWSSRNRRAFPTSPENRHSQLSKVGFPCRKTGSAGDLLQETLWNVEIYSDIPGAGGWKSINNGPKNSRDFLEAAKLPRTPGKLQESGLG